MIFTDTRTNDIPMANTFFSVMHKKTSHWLCEVIYLHAHLCSECFQSALWWTHINTHNMVEWLFLPSLFYFLIFIYQSQ